MVKCWVSVSEKVPSHTAGGEFVVMDSRKDIQCGSSKSDLCLSSSNIILNGIYWQRLLLLH